MPEPLKNCYSVKLVNSIAQGCQQHHSQFERTAFVNKVLSNDWQQLELKERMHRIAFILGKFLPEEFSESIKIVLLVAENYSGLAHMCFPDFVEQYGLQHFELSLMALEELTPACSSEFAIRPFIVQYPTQTMIQMKKWSESSNEHVRRLASEGCRPRLPWAMALPDFKHNPTEVIKVILPLIDDESLYVRRSVANNLNDISKDNPEIVLDVARKYLGKSKEIDWVIKHACRGLLKQGDKNVLSLFGYTDASHVNVEGFLAERKVRLGERLNFEFDISTKFEKLGKLRLEFLIDFMKSNGKTAAKIFKIGEGEYHSSKKEITKYFSFKPISTRKYYLGRHRISIVINGEVVVGQDFKLVE